MLPEEIVYEIGRWTNTKDRLSLFSTCRPYWYSYYNRKPIHCHLLRGYYESNNNLLKLRQQIDNKFNIHAPNLEYIHIRGNFGREFMLPNLTKLTYVHITICWYSKGLSPDFLVSQLGELQNASLIIDIYKDKCLAHERRNHHSKITTLVELLENNNKFRLSGPYTVGWQHQSISFVTYSYPYYCRAIEPVVRKLPFDRYIAKVNAVKREPILVERLGNYILRRSGPKTARFFVEMLPINFNDSIQEIMLEYEQLPLFLEDLYLLTLFLANPATWLLMCNSTGFIDDLHTLKKYRELTAEEQLVYDFILENA